MQSPEAEKLHARLKNGKGFLVCSSSTLLPSQIKQNELHWGGMLPAAGVNPP